MIIISLSLSYPLFLVITFRSVSRIRGHEQRSAPKFVLIVLIWSPKYRYFAIIIPAGGNPIAQMEPAAQPSLFDTPAPAVALEQVILFALGEFQSRGHELAGRELALDRLRHAVVRACEKFGVGTPPDETVASVLGGLGAKVVEIPAYFAKRPFRVTVPSTLASEASSIYHQLNAKFS